MNPIPDPAFVTYDRFRRWFSDRGKDLFFAFLQCLIGGGLTYSIVVSSWQAGSFPPKRPDGINDVYAAAAILTWSLAAFIASIGIIFRARWAWKIQIVITAAVFVLQVYAMFLFDWRGPESLEDWVNAVGAVALTAGLGSWVIYAYRKAFPRKGNNDTGVHSASHESATNKTR